MTVPNFLRLHPMYALAIYDAWQRGRRQWIKQHHGEIPDRPLD